MRSMLKLTEITLQRGVKVLLSSASLTVFPGHKVGLIGANGSGKSSLMALLRGELHQDAGNVEIPPGWVVAHVAQETPALGESAHDFVLGGDQELQQIQEQLREAEILDQGNLLGELHAQLAAIDGYSASARVGRLLNGLGFSTEDLQRPVSSFSGGWRMRLNLARALMCRSDLLLLDEPTNHLDLETVVWLEAWLRSYRGTALVISHDRDFLDATVSHIVHVHERSLILYSGSYSDFERQRAERMAQQQALFDKQQREVAHLQTYIDRFRAQATKARQAQSRIKALERMELVVAARVDSPFTFEFREPLGSPNPLLTLDHAAFGYGGQAIVSGIKLSLQQGDRIGLLGVNGAGKSTLIKGLAGSLAPLAGERHEARGLRVGYFAQHQLENLDLAASPLLHLQRLDKTTPEQRLRDFLGGFNFRGEMATCAVAPFSGGEKARLALAMLIWQRPNLLLLDEPTNHLDLDMREALTMALQGFQGAMLVVSHDRHLLRATTDLFWSVGQGAVTVFDGDLDTYTANRLSLLQDDKPALAVAENAIDRREQRRQEAAGRQQREQQAKPLRQRLAKLEQELDRLTQLKATAEAWLTGEEAYLPANKQQLADTLKRVGETGERMQQVELDWLELSATLDGLQ